MKKGFFYLLQLFDCFMHYNSLFKLVHIKWDVLISANCNRKFQKQYLTKCFGVLHHVWITPKMFAQFLNVLNIPDIFSFIFVFF